MVEVYLDGGFGREYRKLMSAIPAGFGAGRHREDAERPAERVSGRGEGGESGAIETSLRRRGWPLFPRHLFRGALSSSKRVAPVPPAPVPRRPLFVEEGGTCSASLFRACSSGPRGGP